MAKEPMIGLLLKAASGDREKLGPSSGHGNALDAAASAVMKAMHGKNVDALKSSLRAFVDACDMAEDEAEGETEDTGAESDFTAARGSR